MLRVRVALLASLLAVSAAWADAEPVSSPDSVGTELDPGVSRAELPAGIPRGPLAVFAAVEKAWAEENVDAFVRLLDPDGRVRIAMASAGPRGGWFNRDQAYYLIKDMFEFTTTERFEFERYWNLDSSGRSPYAVAVRRLRTDEGGSRADRVYISLRKHGDDWFVGEIRSIDQ
ncbi:MAG: DUF4783 domain-containing protein [bacterium]